MIHVVDSSNTSKEQLIFVASLERYLHGEICKCSKKHNNLFNRDTLEDFKRTVRDCFINILSRSEIRLSEKSVEWLSLEYFKHIEVNSKKLGEMLIVSQCSPRELPDADVEILKSLFRDTDIGDVLNASS